MRSTLNLLVAVALACSCADFDIQEQIEDLRVLAVKTEPAEVHFSPVYPLIPRGDRPPFLELPTVELDVEVLAFDPRGGPIESLARLCPANGGSCSEFETDPFVASLPEDLRADAAVAFEPLQVNTNLVVDEDPTGRLEGLEFQRTLAPGAIDVLVGNSGVSLFPTTPRISVHVRNTSIPDFDDKGNRSVQQEIAFKRVPFLMDFDDPLFPPELNQGFADIFGVEFCASDTFDDSFEEGPADCFQAIPPNENPRFLGFQLGDGSEPLAEGLLENEPVDLGRESVLRVPRGSVVQLNPVFAEGVREQYQVFSFEIETSSLFVQNRLEDIVVSYYVTRGNVSVAVADLQFRSSLGVAWTVPTERESGDRDALVFVIRDQRGGVEFGQVTVEYP